jgi:hypothetical protein
MRSILLSAALLAVAGCGRDASPPPTIVAHAEVTAPASLTLRPAQVALCPTQWTCDFIHWYLNKPSCLAACGSGCAPEQNCNSRCFCQ